MVLLAIINDYRINSEGILLSAFLISMDTCLSEVFSIIYADVYRVSLELVKIFREKVAKISFLNSTSALTQLVLKMFV